MTFSDQRCLQSLHMSLHAAFPTFNKMVLTDMVSRSARTTIEILLELMSCVVSCI
jgi:hypothetical protein